MYCRVLIAVCVKLEPERVQLNLILGVTLCFHPLVSGLSSHGQKLTFLIIRITVFTFALGNFQINSVLESIVSFKMREILIQKECGLVSLPFVTYNEFPYLKGKFCNHYLYSLSRVSVNIQLIIDKVFLYCKARLIYV